MDIIQYLSIASYYKIWDMRHFAQTFCIRIITGILFSAQAATKLSGRSCPFGRKPSSSPYECKKIPTKFANLISKLNFYKLIPYPMDNSLSGRRRPARQTSEKDVLCFHRPGRSSTVHSPDGVSYFLPV